MKKNFFEGIKICCPINNQELVEMDILFSKWNEIGIFNIITTNINQTDKSTTFSYSINHKYVETDFFENYDTCKLSYTLLDRFLSDDLRIEGEIWIGLLTSPIQLLYPSHLELSAMIRTRITSVKISKIALIDFHTEKVNRPTSHWEFKENIGFILKEKTSLTEALCLALFPPNENSKYSFSCQRATEYILLLALAAEVKVSNPLLYSRLELRWSKSPIAGQDFQKIFLNEIGSIDKPLPKLWLIPGDRVWFKNPDDRSSDVKGYEGSWVIYLGNGKFSNFWEKEKYYTIESKCVEIFCWRYAVEKSTDDILLINEERVIELKNSFTTNPNLLTRIMDSMMSYRDPVSIYGKGGALDSTREHLKYILPSSSDIYIDTQ